MIQQLPINFDLYHLENYFKKSQPYEIGSQISLKYRKGEKPYQDGVGSAVDANNLLLYKESDFTELVEGYENPISGIIRKVEKIAKDQYQLGIGRIRFMTQMPKTCLSYHRDSEKFRFHIPLSTHSNCFFVVDDQVFRMPEVGALYTLRVDKLHTSVNANKEKPRTHLVFTTFNLK